MRFQSLIYAISGTIVLSCTPFVAGDLAAQELSQCFIESKPCGDPETLYRQIRECLKDPNLCHRLRNGVGFAVHSGDTRIIPLSPTSPRSGGLPRSRLAAPPVGPDIAVAMPAEDSLPTVDALAHDLPLEPAIRDLTDALPTNIGAVELRLGLRRTRVAGIDMRGKIPSSAEIVQALKPRESSSQ